jgi:hypothetical protein
MVAVRASWYARIFARALQKHMHEIHADSDHAMCNIQNSTIPVVQLTHFQKLSTKNFEGTDVLKRLQ